MNDDTGRPAPPAPDSEAEPLAPALQQAIERSMALQGQLFADEDLADNRRLLLTLARTHPRFSDWLAKQEPERSEQAAEPPDAPAPEQPPEAAAPDKSGTVRKRDRTALLALAKKTARGGGR